MDVPLLDLKAQFAAIGDELMQAIDAVMESQRFINGPQVRELELRLAEYCGCAEAVGVSSGTDALLASLMSLGIGPGDEVVTTPFSFFATASSVWRVGARPVFVDIEPDTFNVDVRGLEAALTERTRALMPVHLFGQMADMDSVLAVAEKHGLLVIEDAAQAIGASWQGHPAGSLGTLGCFSFYPSKNLGALGDGGLVVTQDGALAEKLRRCRDHGAGPAYQHAFVGGNFRLDTLQAAALLVKLRHLDGWHAARRANAVRYDALLAGIPEIVLPTVRKDRCSIFNQYVVRVPDPPACREHLQRNGIGCAIYYPLSLHQQECFASLGYRSGDFPEAERAAREVLALPVHPDLSEQQLEYVASKLEEYVASRR